MIHLQLVESPFTSDLDEVRDIKDQQRTAVREITAQQLGPASYLLANHPIRYQVVEESTTEAHLGLYPATFGLLSQ
jgi:hypothetical protein